MANDGFNGSTLTFPSTSASVGKIVSIQFTEDGNAVDLTTLDDTTHVFGVGIKDVECVVETKGVNTLTVGTTGALAVTWFDGGSEAIGAGVLTARDRGGSLDGELTTSLTFKPAG